MRRIFAIIVAMTLLAIAMTACSPWPNEKPNIVENAATPAEFVARAYLMDSWREDAEDGTRAYYVTLLMHSNDYYGSPTANDIQYLTDEGYEKLTDAIENSSITVYDLNDDNQNVICACAKIKTDKLIDLKKIYVYLAGPVKYDENALTEDAYKAMYGNTDGWQCVLASVSEKTIDYKTISNIQTMFDHGLIRLYDDNYTQYYYSSTGHETIIDGNRMMTKVEVDCLQEASSLEKLVQQVIYGDVADIVDNEVVKVDLDERLRIACEIVDNELWVGFETVDGTNVADYDGVIPDAITYTYEKTYCFVVG